MYINNKLLLIIILFITISQTFSWTDIYETKSLLNSWNEFMADKDVIYTEDVNQQLFEWVKRIDIETYLYALSNNFLLLLSSLKNRIKELESNLEEALVLSGRASINLNFFSFLNYTFNESLGLTISLRINSIVAGGGISYFFNSKEFKFNFCIGLFF